MEVLEVNTQLNMAYKQLEDTKIQLETQLDSQVEDADVSISDATFQVITFQTKVSLF